MEKKYKIIDKKYIKKLDKIVDELKWDELKQYIYNKWYYDKLWFWQFFLEDIITSAYWKHHKEIIWELNKKIDLNIIIARWHWKTTMLLLDILHSLLYKTYNSQLYVATKQLWEEFFWKIIDELLRNKKILTIFWDLIPDKTKEFSKLYWKKKFRQSLIELTNWVSLELITPWWSIRWKRPERIVVDDIDKEAHKPETWNKEKTWFLSSVYWTLMDSWHIITIWTIVWNLCLVKYLKDAWWNTIEYAAIINWKVLWAWKWSIAKLNKRKEKLGSLIFNQEYMNIAMNSEDSIIKQEDIKYFDYKKDKIEFDRIYMWLDPAISEKTTADEFWITITWLKWKDKYVIKNLWLKGKQKRTINRNKTIMRVYEEYNVDKIFVEDNGFQTLLKEDFEKMRLNVKWVTSIKDKVTYLLQWQGDFESWKIFFNENEWATEDLQTQLLSFPDVAHDDRVDSMVRSFWPKKTKKRNRMVVSST